MTVHSNIPHTMQDSDSTNIPLAEKTSKLFRCTLIFKHIYKLPGIYYIYQVQSEQYYVKN